MIPDLIFRPSSLLNYTTRNHTVVVDALVNGLSDKGSVLEMLYATSCLTNFAEVAPLLPCSPFWAHADSGNITGPPTVHQTSQPLLCHHMP